MEGTYLYFIAILMPPDIASTVVGIKEEFAARFHSRHALKTPPHVTLQAPFYMNEKEEPKFKRQLTIFFDRISAFDLHFKNYGRFNGKKNPVIFINPEPNEQLDFTHNELMFFLRDLDFPEEQTRITFHPHMTVAYRDLQWTEFEKAWQEFENRNFDAEFRVRHAHLLRHDGQIWHAIASFALKG
ncbi:MAG TPA: 2'-5' RNA ligase family protein [Puia sp.]|nr:2'-5' RNA ligase family protein [Puia sp.]